MPRLKAVLGFVDRFNDVLGQVFALIIAPMVLIIVFEVVMRYAFNAPTVWANETSWYLFGAMFMFGGAYALRHGAHINVDILLVHLSPRGKAITNLLTIGFAFLFLVILFWKGIEMSLISLEVLERSATTWGPPVYPMKIIVPVATLFMLLQTIVILIRNVYTAVTGEEKL